MEAIQSDSERPDRLTQRRRELAALPKPALADRYLRGIETPSGTIIQSAGPRAALLAWSKGDLVNAILDAEFGL